MKLGTGTIFEPLLYTATVVLDRRIATGITYAPWARSQRLGAPLALAFLLRYSEVPTNISVLVKLVKV